MADIRLSEHFKLSELLRSDIALRRGLDNAPPGAVLQTMAAVLVPGLERVRAALGAPMHITSGYRGPAVNAAVGGGPRSQHLLGEAADFVAPTFGSQRDVARFLAGRAAELGIDQLIYEGTWCHVSFRAARPRHEALTAHFDGAGGVSYSRGVA
jgi:hypothetical protein